MSKRDDHATEIKSVKSMNTKLKSELAEMDIKCNDLSDQRDRLQVLVSEPLWKARPGYYARNQDEQLLLQKQALQEELHSSRNRTYELQQQLDWSEVNETIKLCDSMLINTTRIYTQKMF
ncbi:hypothetical protein EVAR_42874_1 [Eumeta japonica]|uniref:Uncharacterized protein n=1 Tax=Eumeta variegata TaxID=151549 RepID=A0A4C1YIX8_EUMVA|nr:hypothetical protein EVAR_42874_1 [Eumeta japonica]